VAVYLVGVMQAEDVLFFLTLGATFLISVHGIRREHLQRMRHNAEESRRRWERLVTGNLQRDVVEGEGPPSV
jgi:hypothetical protein